MSMTETPTAQPVGHEGARVRIQERPPASVNGWVGVALLAGCVAGMIVSAHHDGAWIWAPILAIVLVATSLVIVTPGQTSRSCSFSAGTSVPFVVPGSGWCSLSRCAVG